MSRFRPTPNCKARWGNCWSCWNAIKSEPQKERIEINPVTRSFEYAAA